MAALNPNDLAKFKGLLYVRPTGDTGAFTRLASVRGLVANIDTTNVVEVRADDTGVVYKATDVQATVEAELLENMDRDLLTLLFTGTASDVAGVATPVVGEDLGTGWTVWQPIKLANKNWDNTQVASITVYENAVGLVDGTDYDTYVWDGINGELGYTYIVPLAAKTLAITADYTYTPNASEDISINLDTTEVKNFEVKIVSTSNGKDRTTILSDAAFTAPYGMNYADVFEAGDITGATLTFTWNKGSTLTYSNEIL